MRVPIETVVHGVGFLFGLEMCLILCELKVLCNSIGGWILHLEFLLMVHFFYLLVNRNGGFHWGCGHADVRLVEGLGWQVRI